MVEKTIEERLYECFKTVFDDLNGELEVKLNNSKRVCNEVGFECAEEFIDEMYQRWLSEGNTDRG